MFKKILIGCILASTALFAEGTFGVDVGTKIATGSNKNVLGIQPIKELVGDGGTSAYIEGYLKADTAQIGLRYSNVAEYDEHKLELAWKYHFKETGDLSYFINGGFGFGFQEGKTKTISTNITKTEYVTQNNLTPYKVSTQVKMDDSTYTSFSIGLGMKYKITQNWATNIGYEFERKSWNIDYDIAGKTENVSLSGIAQNYHGVRAAIVYTF